MKFDKNKSREDFLSEIKERDTDSVAKNYIFVRDLNGEWLIICTKKHSKRFMGSISEALDSESVPNDFKDFLIFNLEIFK